MSVDCAETLCCDTAPRTWRWTRIAVGAFVAGNSMTVALAVNLTEVEAAEKLALQSIPLLAAVAVAALLGADLFRNAWAAIRDRHLTIESLFVVAAVGAFTASILSYISGEGAVYFEVTAIVLVIYSLGQELAQYTKSRVLSALVPWDPAAMRCEVMNGETSEDISITSVRSGDYVRVHPGSMIPVDGVVSEGEALAQEGGMTGELVATTCRRPGHTVLAGTYVVDATLVIRATVAGSARSLDRVLNAVRDGVTQPGSSQVTADRIARWFVPAVLVTAVLAFMGHSITAGAVPALFHAMAVLLVACPCALGFATPVAVWTAMRRLQALGLHVKRGDSIEKLAAVDVAVFDKTGTLGVPDPLPALRMAPGWRSERKRVEQLVGAAEAPLNHPFARILTQMKSGGTEYRARRIRVEPGRGVAAEVETSPGVACLVRILGASGTPEVASLLVEIDGARAATILLREKQRPHARDVPEYLRRIGIETALVTGDRIDRTTQFGFTTVHASLTPEQKLTLVQELKEQGHRVVFVGDEMNDAAAMANSDVSIAIGQEPGLSQQVASIIWPAPRFDRLARAIAICRDTVRLVRSNLLFALGYNVIGIAIAAMGLLHPIIAAMLMTISSCVVVLRSLRLLDEKEPGLNSHETAS